MTALLLEKQCQNQEAVFFYLVLKSLKGQGSLENSGLEREQSRSSPWPDPCFGERYLALQRDITTLSLARR